MKRGRWLATGVALALAGCGGGDDAPPQDTAATVRPEAALTAPEPATPPLGLHAGGVVRAGRMNVRELDFTAADGQQIGALFAVPRDRAARHGCVIFQAGLGARRDAATGLYDGFAALGLPVLTIDVRNGARGGSLEDSGGKPVAPGRVAADLRGTVLDLRRALDVLDAVPACRDQPIAYVGVSLGALLGIVLAGADERVDALVAMVSGAGWGDLLDGGVEELWRFPDRAAAIAALAPYDPGRWIGRVSPRPVLLINGREDPVVPLRAALRLQRLAGQPNQTYIYEGGHDPLYSAAGPDVSARVEAFLKGTLAAG